MNKQGNQEYWNRLLLTELPIPKEEIKDLLIKVKPKIEKSRN